jgi:hypothetical protein
MGKSSIHVRPVTSGSERHNNRETKLNYVREDLAHLNSSFKVCSIKERNQEIKERYEHFVGQKMQAKSTPIREAVLLISEKHNAEDLKNLANKIENRFGIKTIQAYCHKDEGHFDKATEKWKPNYHAHMVFDWTNDKTGKTIKMSREDMSELQTLVANELGLERGVNSSKRHIESTKYKSMKEEEELQRVYKVKKIIPAALKTISTAKALEKEINPLKSTKNSLLGDVKQLKENRDLLKFDLDYVKEKVEKEKKELEKIREQKEERSKGFGGGRGRSIKR